MVGLPGESQVQDPGLQEASGDGNSRKEDRPATENEKIAEVENQTVGATEGLRSQGSGYSAVPK